MESIRHWNDAPLKWETIKLFSERARPLEIFIENKSKYALELTEDFLDSGQRVDSTFTKSIAPGSSWLTLVANKPPGMSVGGGLKYKLQQTKYILYLGFSNPCLGGHKTFVCLSDVEQTAKWAYQEAKDGFFKSCSFEECRAIAETAPAKYCPSQRIVFTVDKS
ncbi:hypothetical protein CHS0354_037490 [Potamilus streckersoni]|uniref:Uncharacterized protein n=1 Tax=Potamilus streckersoni TaxID=2493646 RepID=A0AAE0VGJ8_9BIVA|nr:hypothetical protein CHS0354_037490 [Potamilus streckersoni]